jgi:hypothetical protein
LSNEDSTQLVCGQLRERYGIAGDKVDFLLSFVNKAVSKRRLAGVVKTPKFVEFDKAQYQRRRESYLRDITNQLDFPLFTKPIDLVSKFEVHKVNGFSDLQAAAEQLVQSPYEFEIDEFITGELFHCDVVMNHGNIVFTMIAQYAFPLARFSEGKPIGSIPVAEQRLLTMLNEFATKVITQLGCQHGTYHLKVYLESKSQELVFLEISARTAGILIPRFYEIQFGIHLEELHYLVHMGKLDENFSIKPVTQFAGWVAYPKLPGIIANIKEPPIEVGYQFDKLLQTGDITHNIDSLLDAACNVVFWDESLQKIQRAFEVLKQFQPLEFTDLEQSAIQQLAVPKVDIGGGHSEVVDALFNTVPFVFWKDRLGKYLGCNLNQANAFNFDSVTDLVGKTIYEILEDQEYARTIDEIDNRIMCEGVSEVVVEYIPTPQGKKKLIIQKQPLRNSHGKVIGLMGFAMDITALRVSQEITKEVNREGSLENYLLELESRLAYVDF